MGPVVPIRDPEAIENEACAWVAQVDGGAMSQGDVEALKEWIARSPQHKAAFERMASKFLVLRDPLNVLDKPKAETALRRRQRRFFFGRPVQAVLGFASLILVAFLSVNLFLEPAPDSPLNPPIMTHYADIGEQRTIVLTDGSRVILNTNSRIDVAFNAQERAVHLIYGEAIFDVEKDAARPFKVHTQKGVVRAIGTVFSVRVRKSAVEVLVEEGTVEVAPKPSGLRDVRADGLIEATQISSGKYASFNEIEQRITTVDPDTLGKRLSWREGILKFDVDPLSYVIEEVSRYTDVKIVISDPSILDTPVGGSFKVGETQALLDALEKGFGVKVNKVRSDLVYLSPGA